MSAVLDLILKKDGRNKVILTENGRVCLKCKQGKIWDLFANDAHGYNRKTATCLDCRKIKHKEVYDSNPNVRRSGIKNRPDKLKRLYGITYADAVRTLDSQFGRCANVACSKEISLETKGARGNRAVIDHDHKTGKFRALLCSKCNLDLGIIENNEARFLGLMQYKTKHTKDS